MPCLPPTSFITHSNVLKSFLFESNEMIIFICSLSQQSLLLLNLLNTGCFYSITFKKSWKNILSITILWLFNLVLPINKHVNCYSLTFSHLTSEKIIQTIKTGKFLAFISSPMTVTTVTSLSEMSLESEDLLMFPSHRVNLPS